MTADHAAGATMAWREVARATLGGLSGRGRGGTLLSMLAIGLGVALGYAVALINQTAVGEFTGSMATLSGNADLEVRGPRDGFDESVFVRLAQDPDIAVASPVLETDARIKGRDDALAIFGVDAFRAAAVTPSLVGHARDPLDLLRPGVAFVSPAASASLGVRDGDVIIVQAGLSDLPLTVGGTVQSPAAQRYAVVDIAAAQEGFGRVGKLTRIDLRLRPGIDAAVLRARLQQALPPGVAVDVPRVRADAGVRMSRAYRVNLNVLALVALFTGGLLVFSTQALSVVRRRAQFALLRTLGLPRRRLLGLLLAEGAAVGAAGSVLGLVTGYVLARVALRAFGGDLGAGFFQGIVPAVAVEPAAAVAFGALGITAAVLGALVPALEAARAAPARALKAGDEETAFHRLRSAWPGAGLLVGGGGAALLPPVRELPLFGYLAIALLLVGTLLLIPRLAAFLLAHIPRPGAVPSALALDQLRGAPGQMSMSLATIVASVSLMVSMAIMVASFRHSLDDWLQQVLPADVYVRSGAAGDSAYFSAADQVRFGGVRGLRRVDFLRVQSLLLDAARPRVVLLARDFPPGDPAHFLPLVAEGPPHAASDPPAAWVSEALVDLYGFAPGQHIVLPLAGRAVPFIVAGVWRDYARQQGAVVIARAEYARLTGDSTANDAALWLDAGTRLEDVRQEIESRLATGGSLTFSTPGDIRAISLRVFDRTFAVTYALEAAAVGIGLVGLSSSFGALVFARRREFGVLRHIGLTRGQVARMLATEGLVVSGIGLAVGLGLGWVMSLILIFVVNRQSFHWGMGLHVPWLALALLALVLLALAMATSLLAARQAMGRDVVRAVKDDW